MEEEQNRLLEKQLFFNKLTAIFTGSTLAVVVLVSLILVPRVFSTLKQLDGLVEEAKTTLADADTTLADIADMSTSVTTLSNEFTTFLKEDATAITDAAADIDTIDFESLNDAIKNLKDAVEPFANLMNRLRN